MRGLEIKREEAISGGELNFFPLALELIASPRLGFKGPFHGYLRVTAEGGGDNGQALYDAPDPPQMNMLEPGA